MNFLRITRRVMIISGIFTLTSHCSRLYKTANSNNYVDYNLKDRLTYKSASTAELIGSYNFIILPGFQGHTLRLDTNHTFKTRPWGDIGRRTARFSKGNWHYDSQLLTLRLRFGTRKMTLKIHKYSWATFLVPVSKEAQFAHAFHKNQSLIDSLAPFVTNLKTNHVESALIDFKGLCFLRRVYIHR